MIPGGVVSVNRAIKPEIAFVRGRGSQVWDADGNEYIDYHTALSPYLLGHSDPDVDQEIDITLEKTRAVLKMIHCPGKEKS